MSTASEARVFVRKSDMIRPANDSPLGRQLAELEQVEIDVNARQQKIAQLRDEYQDAFRRFQKAKYKNFADEETMQKASDRMYDLAEAREQEEHALRPVLARFHRLQAEFENDYATWRQATAAAGVARSYGG